MNPEINQLLIDYFAKTALFATNEVLVAFLLIIGYYSSKRTPILRALFILLFSLIVSTFLKSFWKIPYQQANFIGYAFPSGHMQAAIAFWGWLAWEFQKPKFFLFVLILFPCIAFALIHLGFHTLFDVSGAIVFQFLILAFYALICNLLKKTNTALIGFVLALIAMPIIYFTVYTRPSVWLAMGALLGASVGFYFENRKVSTVHSKTKHKTNDKIFQNFDLPKIITAILGVAVLSYSIELLKQNFFILYSSSHAFMIIQSFILALWLSYGASVFINTLRNMANKKRS